MTHLTEADRQTAADGTLDARRKAEVSAHLAECAECAADVARLRALLGRVRAEPPASGDEADEWPAIRARIEQGKIVPLPAVAGGPRRGADWRAIFAAVAAAAAMVAVFVLSRPHANAPSAGGATPDSVAITAAADSTTAYREQIADLMSDLELRRGLLRTETSTAIDRDLKECDAAIAELDSAIKADPANPALRQMLAASYRRKLDVLRRVGNAS
jgi:anti-sigma factor RsiW